MKELRYSPVNEGGRDYQENNNRTQYDCNDGVYWHGCIN